MNLPYVLSGRVEAGNHLGNTVGMPTANITPLEDVSMLEKGVYYSDVLIGEKTFHAITNLGTKPTVNSTDTLNAESFIYDFDGDIYGEDITVRLLEFKRPEMRFPSFDMLAKQMEDDIEKGREFHKNRIG